jgi:hypothetical protein
MAKDGRLSRENGLYSIRAAAEPQLVPTTPEAANETELSPEQRREEIAEQESRLRDVWEHNREVAADLDSHRKAVQDPFFRTMRFPNRPPRRRFKRTAHIYDELASLAYELCSERDDNADTCWLTEGL